MDKNRIEGRQGASRWHNTPKASGMPLEVNTAAVRRSSVPLPGEIPPPEGGGKSAEAIVAGGTSRGLEDARSNYETGGLNPTKGRTNEEGINPATDKPADDAGRRGGLESRGGGKHGAPQERNMIEEILEPGNLAEAWKRVKANKGAPGIDGMTVGDFPAFARKEWPRIAEAIRKGDYRPAPVKRAWIPKPDGSKRPLGIPTVLDRVIQQAVAQVLGPLFEAGFSEHSHGYRPGRSAHQAVAVMEESWREGRRHAVECDLKSFFDTVNHDRLMNALREKVRCSRVLGLVRRYLTAGVVLPDGTREATPQGVPQGGPLSPLLANIVLDPLDKELEARGHRFARYADDFIVTVKSAKAAQRVLASLVRYCEERLQLVVNRAKSRAGPLKSCEFLGYRLNNRAKPAWTEKAQHRFKERIREWERSGHDGPPGPPRRGERSESNHQPQPRAPGAERHRRTEPVCPRLAQLLQAQLHLLGGAGTVGLGQAAGEVVLLEAMEAAAHAPPSFARVGSFSRPGAYGDTQPQRLLADEPELACAHGPEQPMDGGTWSPRHESNLDRPSLRAESPGLIGTAGYGAVCPVVWDPWLAEHPSVSHGDPILPWPISGLDVLQADYVSPPHLFP